MANIKQTCPGCGKTLTIPSEYKGRASKCPACKAKFTVGEPPKIDAGLLEEVKSLARPEEKTPKPSIEEPADKPPLAREPAEQAVSTKANGENRSTDQEPASLLKRWQEFLIAEWHRISPKIPRKSLSIPGALIIIALLFFLLCFHIVVYPGGITLVAKEHLSLSEPVVNLTDIIEQYNERDWGEKLRGEGVNLYLVRKLKKRGLIVITDPSAPSSNTKSGDTRQKPITTFFETIRVDAKPTGEKNQFMGEKYSWLFSLRNITQKPKRFSARIKFLDKDDFELHHETKYDLYIEGGKEKTFTGTTWIDSSIAEKVLKVSVDITF